MQMPMVGIGFDGVDIDEMYQKMARLRLHVETFKDCVHSGTVVEEARMIGAYRIYYGSVETDHPDTAEVFKRWIAEVPYSYSTIRIPQKALLLPPHGDLPRGYRARDAQRYVPADQ
ncbi:MAG: hypothetical protein IJH85_00320 [Clostridia bacterium]|nr:hypothetical protein [Clostridia bacterium]